MSTIRTGLAALFSRARHPRPAAAGRGLAALLAVTLVAAGMQAAGAGPALAGAAAPAGLGSSTGSAPAPVSNAFAMGSGASGSIDQRTGAFEAQVPLVSIAGRAGGGLSLTLSYDQSMAAQGIDRFGLGAGWGLGVPWVNTAGGVHVYPASGGSYAYDTNSPTGLYEYPLRDLTFAKNPGTIPARPGAPAQVYEYTLTYLDGTTDYFDANGNLVEQADRFGNPIDLTWQQSGSSWRPATVVDSYGQTTRFDYTTPGVVKVISPVNAENITAAITLHIDAGRLTSVMDPLDQQTSFGYTPVTGLTSQLLNSIVTPTGAHTSVSYTPLSYEPGVVAVNNITVTDAAGTQLTPRLHFDINPPGNSQHNYTGYPNHVKVGSDGLFNSGDFGYRYTTELTNGTSTVDATYNSLHLLVGQKVYVHPPGGAQVLSQAQTYTYPTVTSVANLPANYAKPTSVSVAYGDPQTGATRTVTTSSAYNDKGEQTSSINAAETTTTTTYNSYGLPETQTVTGKDGATSVTTNTFTTSSPQCPQDPDSTGKSVKTTTTAVGATAKTATARTVATYDYNCFGQVTGETLAWAPGAKPPGDSGGPDHIDTTQQISTDTTAHTQTQVVTNAAGTPQASSTTTVTDLVTGQIVSRTTPGNQTTSYTYDALGRVLTVTAPGGQITKTVYDSPTVTTVTAPSGLVTQTTTDPVGRTIKVTDNVSGEKLVSNPAARTLETDAYGSDGTQLTTTTPDGTTTTTFDPLGRPVKVVQPGGITQTESYDDVANTQKVSLVPAGAALTSPVSVTTTGFNDLNQPVSSSTAYPDGTSQAPTAESYDGLGRVTSYIAGNVTASPGYTGAGGLQDSTTLTPGDTAEYPGQPAQAATSNTMTGALTAKALTAQPAGQARTGQQTAAAGTSYTYNAAGQVATATTADHATTSYSYTPAGQIATVTEPSGIKTTYTYDPKTGRLGQVDVRTADGITQDTGYTYDPATGRVASVFHPADPADAIRYDYDADGHLTAVHYPDGTSTAASYDDNGELATTTDITGAVTSYTYNTDGKCGPARTDLCKAVQTRGGTTLASVAYAYDSLDRVHTVTRGNGVTTTIDYTDASQVKSEATTTANGTVLRTDAYIYDSHGNVATHTITSALPAPAQAARRAGPAPTTSTTTTTAYRYDAYNRLISSAVYAGPAATGTPTSTTTYTLDAAGNVTAQDTTTSAGTTHTVNTITPGGELTSRTVNGTASDQKFDADGNVTTDLAGNRYTYDPDGEQASATTPAGVATSYTYWPDHTRRTATTIVDGVAHTITYHYATDGKIANETYAGGGPDVTASYLLAVNREARTLDTAAGTAQTTGPGTGYYLTDAHTSVTAMIDASGQVTASYAYGDYGQPDGASPALLPVPATDPAGNAAVNPFTYDDAYTNPTTGTQYLPARTYDPAQGRFLAADAADQFNRYQAFDTNPITDTDPTGQLSVPQILIDAFAVLVFVATAVASGGAAVPVFAAALAGEAIETAAVAATVFNTIAFVTNIGAAATSATLAANDAAVLTGHGFLSDDQTQDLNTATFALGTIGGITSAVPGIADSLSEAGTAAESAATAGSAAAPTAINSVGDAPQEIDYAAYSALFGAGDDQSADIFAASDGEDDLSNSPQQGAQPGSSLGDFLDSSDDEMQGQVAQVSNPDNSPTQLADPQTSPQTLDQATSGFAAEQQQTGYDQDMNPNVQPFAQAEQLPGGPQDTSTEIVPTSTAPATGITNAATGPSPLADATATGVQSTLSGNTTDAAPHPQTNPLGENVPAPAIGINTNSELPGSESLEEPFNTVLTFEIGF